MLRALGREKMKIYSYFFLASSKKRMKFFTCLSGIAIVFAATSTCLAQDGEDLVDNVNHKGRTEIILQHLEENSLYKKMGLKEGDVIKKWNGREIFERDDRDFIAATLKNSKEFSVTVERDGGEKIFHYKIIDAASSRK